LALLVAAIAGAAVVASLLTWTPILQRAFFDLFMDDPEPAPQRDWKEDAAKRQMEKIEARKRKMSKDYVETPEEKQKRLQREYRWKAAQKQSESVAMIGEMVKVKVSVAPPFGMNVKGEDGKVTITGFSANGNAQYMDIRPGDKMYQVEDIVITDSTYAKAMNVLKNAEGPVTIIFERLASEM